MICFLAHWAFSFLASRVVSNYVFLCLVFCFLSLTTRAKTVSFTDCGREQSAWCREFSKHESGWTKGKEEWLLGGLNVCDGADLGGLVPLMVETLCMFHGLTASTP